jgi:DNA invertase Pin-like site-specific DNA recombinase
MARKKLVAYYRVSTKGQGESGLGLEGQTAAVEAYARGQGAEIVRTHVEVETGKWADRPELIKALAHAKRTRATLVIAKLDRLARNVAFTANLMDSGVDFVACDNPHANRLTIHILAAVAENEAKMISERTKAALTAYKARGGVLGAARPDGRRLTTDDGVRGREKAREVRRANARAAVADLAPMMVELRAEGLSLRAIADRLNAEGHTTRRGAAWNPVQVARVLERVGT